MFIAGPKLEIKGEERDVLTLNGVVSIDREEKEALVGYCKKVWKEVISKSGSDNFKGHVRFDLVPRVSSLERENNTTYSWDLEPGGIYEINVNSPECGAAVSALHQAIPKLSFLQPSPVRRITEVLEKEMGEKVYFLLGEGTVKSQWGGVFFKSLSRASKMKFLKASLEEIEKSNTFPLWRFGDIRVFGNRSSEFREEVIDLLYRKQLEGQNLFNSISLSRREDPGNKKHLIREGERELLSEDDVLWAMEEKDLVLKPFFGSSGNGIYFQRALSPSLWEEALRECLREGDYGLFRAKYLPKVDFEEGEVAFDISPSFLAQGEDLHYLYTIIRLDSYQRYESSPGPYAINVAQGAGFVGTLLDE